MSAIDLVSPEDLAQTMLQGRRQNAGPARFSRSQARSRENNEGSLYATEDEAGPSRGRSDSGSDDDVVITGESRRAARPSLPHGILHELEAFDLRLGRYHAQIEQLVLGRELDTPPRFAHHTPPPRDPALPRTAGFGAVIRSGPRSMTRSTRDPRPFTSAQRIRDVYDQGPRSWGVYDSDPLGTSSNPLPGVVFVPELPREEGFVVNFDPTAEKTQDPIELNDEGEVIQRNPYILRCAHCPTPLLLSSAYRSPKDTVWALRCGHLLDQACLRKLSEPPGVDAATAIRDAEALMAGPGARKRKRIPVRKPRRHIWHCPVESCGWPHTSVEGPAPTFRWSQDEEKGAVQLYA